MAALLILLPSSLVGQIAPAGKPSGAVAISDKQAAHKDISDAEAAKLISGNKNVVVLDVRTAREVRRGQIAGARHINFRDADFDRQIARLDREATYIVYCAVGGRSAEASRKMSAMGFKSVYNLEGGIQAWQKAGRKVGR